MSLADFINLGFREVNLKLPLPIDHEVILGKRIDQDNFLVIIEYNIPSDVEGIKSRYSSKHLYQIASLNSEMDTNVLYQQRLYDLDIIFMIAHLLS